MEHYNVGILGLVNCSNICLIVGNPKEFFGKEIVILEGAKQHSTVALALQNLFKEFKAICAEQG